MAKSYLELYVEEASKVYKPEFVSLSVHYLNHLNDDLVNAKSLCGVHARRSACIPKALRYIGTQRVCFLYGKIK
ncbi:unnamed protein product [Trichogramma brassicae]|uniref:Uncharacterized protein n=1 Tax=Trichogramma brassicae TaxID=86971 RepID=A0A6H5IR22_9HYME|nr:unnamed protein product [Trichogramma brassicae]